MKSLLLTTILFAMICGSHAKENWQVSKSHLHQSR